MVYPYRTARPVESMDVIAGEFTMGNVTLPCRCGQRTRARRGGSLCSVMVAPLSMA